MENEADESEEDELENEADEVEEDESEWNKDLEKLINKLKAESTEEEDDFELPGEDAISVDTV